MDDVTFGEPLLKVDSYKAFDLRLGYNFESLGPKVQLNVGVNNVTDEEPPFIELRGQSNPRHQHVRSDRPVLLRGAELQVLIANRR